MFVLQKKLGRRKQYYSHVASRHPRTHVRVLSVRIRQFSEALKLRARHTGALKSI